MRSVESISIVGPSFFFREIIQEVSDILNAGMKSRRATVTHIEVILCAGFWVLHRLWVHFILCIGAESWEKIGPAVLVPPEEAEVERQRVVVLRPL